MEEIKKGYKQTDIGVIPEDWEVKLIKQIFDICNNQRLPLSEEVRKKMQGIFPYYGPTRIQDYINEYRLEGEYALIGEDGDHFLKWKDMSMTQLTSGKFNVNNHAHIIKGKNNITTTRWFYYFFKNRDITGFLARQGAGRYKLSKATLSEIPCAYPTEITEQTAIATVLSDTDALIAALDKKIAKKQQIKQGAMQQLLTGKKRLPGFSGEWVEKKLGELLDYEQPTDYIVKSTDYLTQGIPVLTAGKSFILGYTAETTGIFTYTPVIIFDDFTTATKFVDFKFKVKSSAMKILKLRESKNNIKLIYELMQLIDFPLIDHQRYWISEYSKIIVKIPNTKKEQDILAKILTDMDNEIAQLEKERDKYKELKAGMMQVLLTGKVRLV